MMKYFRSNEIIDKSLCNSDYMFISVIDKCKYVERHIVKGYFQAMVFNIIGQQLATRVAQILVERLINICDGEVTCDKILELPSETLKNIGLSNSKVIYIKEFSKAVKENRVDLNKIDQLKNEEIIDVLTKIKGIGPWTAEMFLIFALGRQDVFSSGDGGLKKAIEIIYNNGEKLTKKEMLNISNKWKPYRTYASLYLWKYISI